MGGRRHGKLLCAVREPGESPSARARRPLPNFPVPAEGTINRHHAITDFTDAHNSRFAAHHLRRVHHPGQHCLLGACRRFTPLPDARRPRVAAHATKPDGFQHTYSVARHERDLRVTLVAPALVCPGSVRIGSRRLVACSCSHRSAIWPSRPRSRRVPRRLRPGNPAASGPATKQG